MRVNTGPVWGVVDVSSPALKLNEREGLLTSDILTIISYLQETHRAAGVNTGPATIVAEVGENTPVIW
jgi:transcriptional regulator of acetoin/glycerol metabolism